MRTLTPLASSRGADKHSRKSPCSLFPFAWPLTLSRLLWCLIKKSLSSWLSSATLYCQIINHHHQQKVRSHELGIHYSWNKMHTWGLMMNWNLAVCNVTNSSYQLKTTTQTHTYTKTHKLKPPHLSSFCSLFMLEFRRRIDVDMFVTSTEAWLTESPAALLWPKRRKSFLKISECVLLFPFLCVL